MSITAIPPTMPAMPMSRAPGVREGPGLENDGDGDDKTVSANGASDPAVPPTMGTAVDSDA
jgi:hypothetical protein